MKNKIEVKNTDLPLLSVSEQQVYGVLQQIAGSDVVFVVPSTQEIRDGLKRKGYKVLVPSRITQILKSLEEKQRIVAHPRKIEFLRTEGMTA